MPLRFNLCESVLLRSTILRVGFKGVGVISIS